MQMMVMVRRNEEGGEFVGGQNGSARELKIEN
jgi:hypothetical protein